jgi:Cu+-exporting ATPase
MTETDLVTEASDRRAPTAPAQALTQFDISGMTCGNCARHVTEAIQAVTGVASAHVNLEGHQATVRWKTDQAPDVLAVVKAVEGEGFGAKVLETGTQDAGERKLSGWRLNLSLGLPATAILMIGEWGFGLGMARWFNWFSFALATVVQVFAGARFYRGAWRQLKVGSSNMDTLVALGSTTAFAYSVGALFTGYHGHLYFMEAVAIITLISLGHWLESRVSVRAAGALRRLLNLTPARARRCLPDGTEMDIPVAELKLGDRVALRPGDRVPTDGEILEGQSAVDESMLTGESVPVNKSAGGSVYAGTVNVSGRLTMQVTATGEATALAHIIAAVQRAQSSRANIQRLGDRVSSIFVPLVVAVALLAGLWWGLAPASARSVHDWVAQFIWVPSPPEGAIAAGFLIAAGVLIIACPCAMGLATPIAIMAGSNAAAQRGILIRDGVALEKAGRITGVIFDKTGTLTLGKPSVVKTWESGAGLAQATVLDFAAALAKHSLHPISQAIAKLSSVDLDFSDWREVHGAGVEGGIVQSPKAKVQSRETEVESPKSKVQSLEAENGQVGRLGSLRWLKESGVDLTPGESFVKEWSAQGATIVGAALANRLLGLFAVKDTLKSGAEGVIAQLHRHGLETYLVTGDNSLTASTIAREVGIKPENVFADVRPEEKAAFVQKLQQRGERLAFVGDGINDAPALEQADLGIAVSRASDIAREAADIILLNSEIEAVPESLGLARATLRTIKQNLFWAFFYNALGIPLAALGFMSPILCAAAMGLSDLVVIGNALRLRAWRL